MNIVGEEIWLAADAGAVAHGGGRGGAHPVRLDWGRERLEGCRGGRGLKPVGRRGAVGLPGLLLAGLMASPAGQSLAASRAASPGRGRAAASVARGLGCADACPAWVRSWRAAWSIAAARSSRAGSPGRSCWMACSTGPGMAAWVGGPSARSAVAGWLWPGFGGRRGALAARASARGLLGAPAAMARPASLAAAWALACAVVV